ncbi:MAG: TonB-dependent starch-binding outer membrane protein SusC [Gemmatimonadales bacterium]|nr:TonB-dependent starch-binding outer membrane protein SusC [Gemmatimonadales bacterium]
MRGLRYSIGLLLATVWITPLRAQEPGGSIRGHVTDAASKQPLQGAMVRVGSRTTQTRADGGYLLAGVPAGTDTLRVTMIGYAPDRRAVTVAEGEILDVDVGLAAQAAQLAELVVIGYGEQRQGNVTGAVTNVTSNEFNTGRVVTPTELIQNKVAGVQVVENNEPGGRTSIRIRGATSTTASNEPLYVVDGQPLGTEAGGGVTTGRDPLNFLNPDDIASITVLRDAASAAIYGTNAANGVILITTKRGQQGQKAHVEYTGSVSASRVTRLPSMLTGPQFRAAVEQYAPTKVGQLQNANTDWFGAIDRTGFGQEHNVAISGAGASNDYRVSLNFLDQKGIISENSARRFSLGTNFTQRLASDRLNLRFHLRGSRSDDRFTPLGVLSNAAQYGATQPILDGSSPTGFYDWPGSSLTSPDNPVAIVNLAEEKAVTWRGIGNMQAEYSLPWVNGLKANGTFGFDVTKGRRLNFTPSTLHREVVTGRGGFQSRYDPKQVNLVLETYLNYTTPKPVGPGILDLIGGYSFTRTNTDSLYYEGRGLSTDAFGNDRLVEAASSTRIVFEQRSKLISFYGRANYNINDKYILAASVRRDGSSRFGRSNSYGTFPSLSVAWRLSQEPFLRGVKALSDLKLRGSWAKTGNQSFGNYLAYSSYQLGDQQTQYQFGDTIFTTSRPSAVDPNIKWEQTRAFNVGLDFGFANQRLTGSIDWYDKSTSDLLFDAPVAAFSNLSNFVVTNVGTMRNRGIEMSLGARVLQGGERGLTWQADFTAARNTNTLRTITPFGGGALKILAGDVSGGVGTRIQVFSPGVPVNSFYVYEHIREGGKPIYRDVNGDSNINEQDLYVDQNGDGIINQGDLRPFHDPAPKWILGHSSYLALGDLDLGFTLRAYLGNYMYNNVASANGDFREISAGSSPYNLHNSVLETQFATQQLQSDFYVEDASFLRLDNLTLGYSFNLRGQSARVFGTVQNLFTITGYSGVDPTANIAGSPTTSSLNGIDNNIYPRSRTFSGGLSLRL